MILAAPEYPQATGSQADPGGRSHERDRPGGQDRRPWAAESHGAALEAWISPMTGRRLPGGQGWGLRRRGYGPALARLSWPGSSPT